MEKLGAIISGGKWGDYKRLPVPEELEPLAAFLADYLSVCLTHSMAVGSCGCCESPYPVALEGSEEDGGWDSPRPAPGEVITVHAVVDSDYDRARFAMGALVGPVATANVHVDVPGDKGWARGHLVVPPKGDPHPPWVAVGVDALERAAIRWEMEMEVPPEGDPEDVLKAWLKGWCDNPPWVPGSITWTDSTVTDMGPYLGDQELGAVVDWYPRRIGPPPLMGSRVTTLLVTLAPDPSNTWEVVRWRAYDRAAGRWMDRAASHTAAVSKDDGGEVC